MKRSIVLLISAILGLVFGICITYYFVEAEAFVNVSLIIGMPGAGIVTALALPYIICICVLAAVIFNIAGWAVNQRGLTMTAGILYSVSAVLFIRVEGFNTQEPACAGEPWGG